MIMGKSGYIPIYFINVHTPVDFVQNLIFFMDSFQPVMFEGETSERLSQPGVAVGLAWTTMGGEIMFVEASRMEGEGKLTLTGQLGDVMKESANLALNWVRGHAKQVSLHGNVHFS